MKIECLKKAGMLIIFVLFFSFKCYSFQSPKSELAISAIERIDRELTNKTSTLDYPQMEEELYQFIELLTSIDSNHLSLSKGFYLLGKIKFDKDEHKSAIDNFTKAINIFKFHDLDTSENAYRSFFLRIKTYGYIGDFNSAINSSHEYISALNSQHERNNRRLVIAYERLAWMESKNGLYEKALEDARHSLKIHENNLPSTDDSYLGTIRTLADIHRNTGDFEKAIEYAERYLEFYLTQIGEKNLNSIYAGHNMLSTTYGAKGDYKKSIHHSIESIKLIEKLYGRQSQITAGNYYNLAYSYFNINEYENALKNTRIAFSIMEKLYGKDHPLLAEILNLQGNILNVQKKYKQALSVLEQSLLIKKQNHGEKHMHLSRTYANIGELQEVLNDYESALNAYQNGIISITQKFNSKDILENPVIEEEQFIQFDLIGLLEKKYKVLSKLCNREKDNEYCALMAQTLEVTFECIQAFKKQDIRSGSIQIQYSKLKGIYEFGIGFYANEFLPKIKGHNEAFNYSEKYKSGKLQENLNKNKTTITAHIPEEFRTEEATLNDSISFFQKHIYSEYQKKIVDSTTIFNLKKKLFGFNKNYDDLQQEIRTQLPKYIDLIHDPNIISIKNIQTTILASNQVLLEYFTGDSSIFAFLITPKEYEIIEIKKTFPLDSLVQQLQHTTYTCHLTDCTEAEKQKEISNLNKTAHLLYQLIFRPIEQAVDLPEELIIIPDGVLGYVPFEMLLKEMPAENAAFSTYPYLLKDYQISYCYSATLLHEMQQMEKGKAKRDFLAFAPSFSDLGSIAAANRSISDTRGGLGKLRYNVPEVTALQRLMGGDIFTGADATEDAFTLHAPDYRILHLATHGKANDQVGDYAYLAFTEVDDSIENELLYNRDLYNLRLNADLVVLSACETGIGELQRGEGIISLARGFSYAGARSIVTTLWSINDATTKELMESFYTNIKAGMTKDAALRQAKLDYINSHPNDHVHPFYWAAFVPIGDMSPVELGSGNWWMWTIGGIIFLGAFYIFWKRK